jgi:hypothetical protein
MSLPRGRSWLLLSLALCAVIASVAIVVGVVHAEGTRIIPLARREKHPQTSWAPCNRNAHSSKRSTFQPLADSAAAALVTAEPETRVDNARAYTIAGVLQAPTTTYVPSLSQIRAFRAAKTSLGQPVLSFNPYLRDVDGRDGMHDPSTDDLIQWAAHKWGIPEDWLRAEYVQESYWSSFQLGDDETVSAHDYGLYPTQARVPGSLQVYQSLGISQVRWDPEGSVGAGTEPLRWKSLAFNVDYQAAMVRFYYDNPSGARAAWGDPYQPCQKWNAIGAWFNAYPWANAGAAQYIKDVKANLTGRVWRTASFLGWRPSSLPANLKLR